MTTPVVLDASAGVEIALGTSRGRALSRLLPAGATLWAPEHYFAETASALRRLAAAPTLPVQVLHISGT